MLAKQALAALHLIPIERQPTAVAVDEDMHPFFTKFDRHPIPYPVAEHRACRARRNGASKVHSPARG